MAGASDSCTPGESPIEVYHLFSKYVKQMHVLVENFILQKRSMWTVHKK